MKISTLYTYAHPSTKEQFATKAMAFLKKACQSAGVQPDLLNEKASPVKRYPYFNRGGVAVLGEAYLHITRGETVLEVIMGESFLYRTRVKNQYGNNNYPCGYENTSRAKDYTEDNLAQVIKKFMVVNQDTMLRFH